MENLLEKTIEKKKIKKIKRKHLKAEDRYKTIIKYEDSEKQLNLTPVKTKTLKTIVKPKINVCNTLKIEVSTPGKRKIINMSEHVNEAMNTDKKILKDNSEYTNKNIQNMENHEENNSTYYNPTNSAFIETLCSDKNITNKR